MWRQINTLGDGGRFALSLTHALTPCQPSAAARCAVYRPANCTDCSSILTAFTLVLELDNSANLARASHHHHLPGRPRALHLHYGNALISSHLLTLSPPSPLPGL